MTMILGGARTTCEGLAAGPSAAAAELRAELAALRRELTLAKWLAAATLAAAVLVAAQILPA